jgi:hypothetical protein
MFICVHLRLAAFFRITEPNAPDLAHGDLMSRTLVFSLVLLLLPAMSPAQDKKRDPASGSEAKAVSGISIVGNNEAPKSLYIVPWKGSELGGDSGLTPGLLDARMAPVDKEVFMREIHYHELRSPQ